MESLIRGWRCITEYCRGDLSGQNKLTQVFLKRSSEKQNYPRFKISIFTFPQVVLEVLWTRWQLGFENNFDFIDPSMDLESDHNHKKYIPFYLYSFQMVSCRHFGLGQLTQRKSTSFWVNAVATKLLMAAWSLLANPKTILGCWFEGYQVVQLISKKFQIAWSKNYCPWENPWSCRIWARPSWLSFLWWNGRDTVSSRRQIQSSFSKSSEGSQKWKIKWSQQRVRWNSEQWIEASCRWRKNLETNETFIPDFISKTSIESKRISNVERHIEIRRIRKSVLNEKFSPPENT